MSTALQGIAVRDLRVAHGTTTVIDGLELDVRSGEFLTLLGPSGCGKSTLLRAIAGLVRTSGGSVHVDGRDVTALAPEERGLGFVFQSYALFPHLTVADNVAFGLRVQRVPRTEVRDRVAEVLTTTGLERQAASMPAQLSGGQQQRVAIARVLVTRPSVLLMDEPLSNLDAVLRVRLRDEIRALHDRIGITTLYVTHDQDEALSMSDRVAVMRDGAFAQVADPREVYDRPADAYVCAFVGASTALAGPQAEAFGLPDQPDLRPHVRPESIRFADGDSAPVDGPSAMGTVARQVFLGPVTRHTVTVAGLPLEVTTPSSDTAMPPVGAAIRCVIPGERVLWLR